MKKLQPWVKAILFIYLICFLIGGLRHWIDIINGGIFPYTQTPFIFNFYLTSLAVFDFLVIYLIWVQPIHGLLLAAAVMATDLPIDLYLAYRHWGISLESNPGLQLLAVFAIFVFMTAPLLIRKLSN